MGNEVRQVLKHNSQPLELEQCVSGTRTHKLISRPEHNQGANPVDEGQM